ncbi:MAG: S-layer family protein [Nitrosomonadales bacterium]|nr:S-layer family protein [Nitrosomonadales bacterium]
MNTADFFANANFTSATAANGNVNAAWDFTNTWWMSDTNTRPFLRSEYSTTITNVHQLQLMAMDLTASYTLANNLDLAPELAAGGMWGSKGFLPVGDGLWNGSNYNSFTGALDGQNFTISNLAINRPFQGDVGLFGVTGTGSSVSNVGLLNTTVSGNINVGGLVGSNSGAISNSYVSGSVSGSGDWVGGLVGGNSGTITNSYVSGTASGGSKVGGLAGYNSGSISNSYVSGGTINSTDSTANIGGLVGSNNGSINNSYVTNGTVVSGGGSYSGGIGGLAGKNSGSISNSYVSGGSVTGTSDSVGGLVGYNSGSGSISNSYVTNGTVVNGVSSVGGLAGFNAGSINNSYVSGGSVTGTNSVGGLVGGSSWIGSISNSHYDINAVTINGGNHVTSGGLYSVQYLDWFNNSFALDIANYTSLAPSVANSYTIGSVQGMKDLLGFADNPAYTFSLSASIDLATAPGLYIPYLAADFDGQNFTISNLSVNQPFNSNLGLFGEVAVGGAVSNLGLVNATVTGQRVGALAGWNKGTISNSYFGGGTISGTINIGGLVGYNTGAVSSSYATGNVSGTSSVGGLVGDNNIGTVSNSYATGNVAGSEAGGLVGYIYSGAVSNSYATGNVSGTSNVGGLVGYYYYGTVSNSYATGNVTGSGAVGGLVGQTYNGSISNVYSAGAVSGASNVGGLIGLSWGSPVITNSFWDTVTSGQTTSAGGTGLTTAQMKNSANFTGWDFATVWNIDAGLSYPYLLANEQIPHPAPPAIAVFWDGGGAGDWLWTNPLNWNTDSLPGSGDAVTLGAVGTVLLTSGNYTINSLVCTAGSFLDISGGSLTVSGITMLGGGLIVSGAGSATLSGALNGATSGQVSISAGSLNLLAAASANSLNMTGGTLNAPASLTVGSYQQTAGTLNAPADFILQSEGDIAFGGTMNSAGGSLTLQAANNILFAAGSSLAPSAGAVNVNLVSDSDGAGGGGIYLDTGSSLASNGGNIIMGGGLNPLTTAAVGTATSPVGVLLDGATISSGAGNISILGQGLGDGGSYRHGVSLVGGSVVQAAGGTITITGTGGNNDASGDRNYGVHLDGAGTLVTSTAGAITVTGTGGSGASQTNSHGVSVGFSAGGAVIQGVGNAIVNVTGTGGAIGGDNSRGVIVQQTGSKITAQNGAINIMGTGPSATYGSVGVQLWGDGNIESTGSGAINITGTAQNNNSLGGGAPATNFIGGPTATGDIFITGNQSISFGSGASNPFNIQTSGNVTINATGSGAFQYGAGSIQSAGLRLIGAGTFSLDSASNNVGTLAANVTGGITYRDADDLTLGAATSFDGTAVTTTTGVTATGNVAITAAAGRIYSGSGGAGTDVSAGGTLNLTATGIGYQSAFYPYTANRLGVSAGGATTLTTTGAGNAGNIYLRADTAMTLGSITTDAATSQGLDLYQALGTLTMPANQASNNDGWSVAAPTGITFLPGSSLTVGWANFSSAGGITAQGDLSVHALAGDLNFYNTPLTAGGIVNLISDTGSLTLDTVTATNTGLPDTTAAITISAPLGYIDLNDNLNATGSGGISLLAYNSIDLDNNDIAPNLITAAGNVNIQSTNGSITNSGSALVTGASVSLDGALGVDTGEVITATTGSVTVSAAGGTAALQGIAAATGISVTADSITNSYGDIVTTGGNISLATASDITLYGYWGGNALTASGGIVTLTADSDGLNGGAIEMLGGGSITANTLNATAAGGIALTTQVSNLTTVNSGAGNTLINNTGALTVNGMTDTSGSVTLNNAGSMTLGGGITANGIALTASGAASDILVNADVISANGMTVNAEHDLSVGPFYGKLIAAGSQTINVGRDMSVIQDNGSAYVESGTGLQTIHIGRDLLVQVNNSSGIEAHIEGGAGQEITVGRNLTLNAFDNDQTRINANGGDQTITVGGNMTLNAQSDIAHVKSYYGMQTVTVGGNLTLLQSNSWDTASMYGALGQTTRVGGNVLLQGGSITGNPDVGSSLDKMTVGGNIYFDDTAGVPARIESVSGTSIWLHYPNLTSGGYFVNDVPEVSNGTSGFFAGGAPAVLDGLYANLHITYAAPQTTAPGGFLADLSNAMLFFTKLADCLTLGTCPENKKEPPPPVVVVGGKAPPADSNAPVLPVCPQ